MCVEGILRETPSGEKGNTEVDMARIRDSAGIAREQILRCRGITQNFLRLSRGQRSPGDIVELDVAIAAVQRLIDPTASAHSVDIEVRPFPPALRVRADEAELQNLLVNLILNAIQASKPGSTVVVQATGGDTVSIRISDEGCGIPPEYRKKIFEPFFSLRSGGTGLGLFLSLNAVRSWGGDIHVQSTPGIGSTFEVVLPGIQTAVQQETRQ
jgi:signal transduction histidine kinase